MQNTTTVNALFNNVATTNNNTAATSKLYCVLQAQAQNKANASKYTAQQQQYARNLYNMCVNSFLRSTCYINLRNNCISVKVANVTKQCLISASVNALLQQVAQHSNITVKQTASNALIFNIKF